MQPRHFGGEHNTGSKAGSFAELCIPGTGAVLSGGEPRRKRNPVVGQLADGERATPQGHAALLTAQLCTARLEAYTSMATLAFIARLCAEPIDRQQVQLACAFAAVDLHLVGKARIALDGRGGKLADRILIKSAARS